MKQVKLKRVLLKISGQCLSGLDRQEAMFDREAMHFLAGEISEALKDSSAQLAIVIGGGNLIRGARLQTELGTTPVIGDQAGMLATVINAILLQDFLEHIYRLEVRVLSAVEVRSLAEPYIRRRAISHLRKNRVAFLAGGTGDPRFTTDTAAVLRAIEIEADAVIKGTKVDGIYDRDPNEDARAKFIPRITHKHFIRDGLRVMDTTAVTLAGENGMSIRVFNIFKKGNLKKVLQGKAIGSLIKP